MMNEHSLSKLSKSLEVLIVEDNQVDLRLLQGMLAISENATERLKWTNTVKGALELLSEREFDVVVLDLNLPDLKGIETIRRVNELFPNIAVVVNTGEYEEDIGIDALEHGAQDFLVKGRYNGYTLLKSLHYAVKRKRLQTELKGAYGQLKEAQDQLVQVEKMKVVGELASGVAHEVRNPLAAIKYGIQYLNEQLPQKDEAIETVLDNMADSVVRANDIITDLLDFSSLSKLKQEQEHLNASVLKGLALINHEIVKKDIQVEKKIDTELPPVRIDRNRIEQVIINLLLNACYSVGENGSITLHTYSKDGKVYFDVVDNGGGIEEDIRGKIYDPFFTTRRAKGGVGLGLSICKNIMDMHNGVINVENRPEGGAIARLEFPIS